MISGSGLLGQCLPQTSHSTCHQGRRERGTVLLGDLSLGINHTTIATHGHHVRLHTPVGRWPHATESRILTIASHRPHGQYIESISGNGDFLPLIVAGIACATHKHNALASQHRSHARNHHRMAVKMTIAIVLFFIIVL